jgi:hypothetical protein
MTLVSIGILKWGASLGWDTPSLYYRARAWWFSAGYGWHSWRVTVLGICLVFYHS